MPSNFVVACHTCGLQAVLTCGGESSGMRAFYSKHSGCTACDSKSVECLDNQVQDREWMSSVGYRHDIEVEDASAAAVGHDSLEVNELVELRAVVASLESEKRDIESESVDLRDRCDKLHIEVAELTESIESLTQGLSAVGR